MALKAAATNNNTREAMNFTTRLLRLALSTLLFVGSSGHVLAAGDENAREMAVERKPAADNWVARVGAKIRSHVSEEVANATPGNLPAIFEISLSADGTVNVVKLIQSSGHAPYDEAALTAIKAASPLSPYPDPAKLPAIIRIAAYPHDH